jgi:hypothetical protein
MSDKTADSKSVVGVVSKTVAVTIKGRSAGTKDVAQRKG